MRHLPAWSRLAVLLLLASGCASAEIFPLAGAPRLSKRAADCKVEFFRSRVPSRPYVELARLIAEAPHGMQNDMEEELRQKACELGADGVVITADTPSRILGIAVKLEEPRAPAKVREGAGI